MSPFPEQHIRLWLDDVRDPVKHGRIGWTWVKTAAEAIALLETGNVVAASLDHDLTPAQTMGRDDGKPNGLTVALWMEANGVFPMYGTYCHSANPDGRQKIECVIRRFCPKK